MDTALSAVVLPQEVRRPRLLGFGRLPRCRLVTAAFSVFSYVLSASTDPVLGLTLGHAAAGTYALKVGLQGPV
jgi:hypothetical protein